MDDTWIIAANAGRARVFSQAQAGEALQEINDMVSTTMRMRTSETESDRTGPTSAGKSIHNTGGALPPVATSRRKRRPSMKPSSSRAASRASC